MLIRAARTNDLPAILAIMNEAILYTTAIYEYEVRTVEFIEDWFIKKQINKEPVIVCDLENSVIGFGTYGQFRPRAAYQFSIEHSVYVKTGFQRQGIGSSLLTTLIDLAQKQGYHTIIAGIDASNQSSYEFHHRFGFIEVARFKEVGYKFDRWLDLIFMQRML
jgi:L-amino acid N-acyltransferase YncA